MSDKNSEIWQSYIQSFENRVDYSNHGILNDIISIRRIALDKLEILASLFNYLNVSESVKHGNAKLSEIESAYRIESLIDRLTYLEENVKFYDSFDVIGDIISRIRIMEHVESQRKKRVTNEKITCQKDNC